MPQTLAGRQGPFLKDSGISQDIAKRLTLERVLHVRTHAGMQAQLRSEQLAASVRLPAARAPRGRRETDPHELVKVYAALALRVDLSNDLLQLFLSRVLAHCSNQRAERSEH